MKKRCRFCERPLDAEDQKIRIDSTQFRLHKLVRSELANWVPGQHGYTCPLCEWPNAFLKKAWTTIGPAGYFEMHCARCGVVHVHRAWLHGDKDYLENQLPSV